MNSSFREKNKDEAENVGMVCSLNRMVQEGLLRRGLCIETEDMMENPWEFLRNEGNSKDKCPGGKTAPALIQGAPEKPERGQSARRRGPDGAGP